ncbi:MAG: glycosyltransferase family 2 protein [Myxococcota bacterium]|nr:glycosyltransferase family 2 protein [Myxococcota bacterium]
MHLSIVVPVFNEEESLPLLISEIHSAMKPAELAYEIVLVDDGSSDASLQVLSGLAESDPSLVIVSFRRNFGQTAAMQAGLDHARGDMIALMDADLQNDPSDIPAMVSKLQEGYDLVAGWRADRKDTFINRRLPSIIANKLISVTTKVHLHDYGCTLKVMTRDVAKALRLYGEMHRFIPAIANWSGARIHEMKVNHRARQFGISKYGISRTVRVILDLMVILFIQGFLVKPMQVFGLAGLVSGLSGFGICGWLAAEKLILGTPLASRPLLLLGVLLIIVGVQLLSFGLLADLLTRTYHESQGKRTYTIRQTVIGPGSKPNGPSGHENSEAIKMGSDVEQSA